MEFTDLSALARQPLVRDPFDHIIVPGFVPPVSALAVRASFPDIRCGGLVPVSSSGYGEDFTRLIAELRSERVQNAFEDKFKVELDPLSLLVTIGALPALRWPDPHRQRKQAAHGIDLSGRSPAGRGRSPQAFAQRRRHRRRDRRGAARAGHAGRLPADRQPFPRAQTL